jgi:transposase
METSLLSLFLPDSLLSHFSIKGIEQLGLITNKQDCYYIELEEKNELPKGYEQDLYESKGFYNTKEIQDFPIRGKAVYLLIKRRRWRLKTDKKIEIKSDYSFISEGSKLTAELSDFLKGTGRDPRRYDK